VTAASSDQRGDWRGDFRMHTTNALAAETFFGNGTRAREKATRSLVSVFHNCLTSRDVGGRQQRGEGITQLQGTVSRAGAFSWRRLT